MQIAHEIPDAVMPNVTAARQEFNATAPAATTGPGGVPLAPGASSPSQFDTDEAFVKYQLDAMVRGWMQKYGLLPATPPAPDPNAVPDQCTAKQGLKALARADQFGLAGPVTEDMILAAIQGMPEDTPEDRLQKIDTLTEFRKAEHWKRLNPFTVLLASMLKLTDAQVVALYRLAVTFAE